MTKLEYCPFCGAELLIFGNADYFKPDEPVTCPDCGRKCRLGELEKYMRTKEDRR